MSSGKPREREVQRYYQSWLESSSGYKRDRSPRSSDRFHSDGSALKSSNDHALIAFAQLGCLRLNAKRGIITLIDSTRQYIVAEATRSLSLISGLGEDHEEDEIWFGNASIPRSQGISESALDPPEYLASDSKGRAFGAPAFVINDLTKDDRYAQNSYAGKGVTFYCGVPIISKNGYPIGVYNVTDDKPRDGLLPTELAFMQDISKIVMQHLQKVYNDVARFRGERLVVGLGNFIRGRSSMGDGYALDKKKEYRILDQVGDALLSPRDEISGPFDGMSVTDADPRILGNVTSHGNLSQSSHINAGNASSNQGSPHGPKPQPSNDRESRTRKLDKIYARAANIMRECVAADGVVFFDASAAQQSEKTDVPSSKDTMESSEDGQPTDSEESISDLRDSSDGHSTASDSSHDGPILDSRGKRCRTLASSIDISTTSSADIHTINKLGLNERSLKRLIRFYPRGKVFCFTENGEASVSESEASDVSTRKKNPMASPLGEHRRSRKQISNKIAEELLHIIPGARNVVWLPLWDFNSQRWTAGTFVWSRNPNRLLAAQDDRVYLRTFGNCIMMELSRLDVKSADEAKSTFIANISHELRSPLHGILGSLEFLQQTSLDPFQSSMTLAVDTCAKTLLDTVEHVLDYTKINQASVNFSRNKANRVSRLRRLGSNDSEQSVDRRVRSNLEDDLNLATLFEEAVEAVYAGQTFRESGQREASKLSGALAGSTSSGTDQTRTTIRKTIKSKSTKSFNEVRLSLRIEKSDNWWVRTQPGAIRRIVTNILGNALKYTDRGTILASLSFGEQLTTPTRKRAICISVKDTGRGMSAGFLANHAFTPFTQESNFSSGTGLGLSIVRQIAHSLEGSVELQSEKNVGTDINVFLDLPPASVQPNFQHDEDLIAAVRSKTAGLSMCILCPFAEQSMNDSRSPDLTLQPIEQSLSEMAKEWFAMNTVKSKYMDGVSADFFVYMEPPPIDYLFEFHGRPAQGVEVPLIIMSTNAFDSASLSANGIHRLTNLGRVLEVISQPCGPLKFAKTLNSCLVKLQEVGGSSNIRHGENEPPQKGVQVENPDNGKESLESQSSTSTTPHTSEMKEIKSDIQTSHSQISTKLTDIVNNYNSEIEDISEKKPPVLLVDDNDINLNLLVAMMGKTKHTYQKAKDGAQAVEAFEKASRYPKSAFKYVLMDINMPVMDGISATRNIRRLEKKSGSTERAIIIALTGFAAQSTQEEMFEAGADYFLTKPVKFKELAELLGH